MKTASILQITLMFISHYITIAYQWNHYLKNETGMAG